APCHRCCLHIKQGLSKFEQRKRNMKSFFKYVLATVTGIILSFVLLFVIGLIIIGGMISSMSADKEVKVADNSLLYMDLKHQITERTIPDPFEDLDIPGVTVT